MPEFIVSVVMLILVLVGLAFASDRSCTKQWEESGMESKWELFSGCRVHMPDGRWVPSKNVRDIDIRPKANQ